MKIPTALSLMCDMLPEMVDIGMGALAEEADVRAAVAEARRVAALQSSQHQTRGAQPAAAPTWPMEPGSLAEAVYWYRQLNLPGEIVRPDAVAASLDNLAYCWRTRRRWAEAEAAFQESLQLRRQHGDGWGEERTLLDLGDLYKAQGRWAEAETTYQQSLALVRSRAEAAGEGEALLRLARLKKVQGDLPAALVFARQAQAALETTADERAKERVRRLVAEWQG
jgi:tetratricopeptide (TPR) repeat protein